MLHVLIALASIVSAGFAYAQPTQKSLVTSYSFIALTLGSGFYLVVTAPAHMIEACMMGVAYLAVVATMTVMARAKFSHLERSRVQNK